jgi:predicted dienelactone hydrolase
VSLISQGGVVAIEHASIKDLPNALGFFVTSAVVLFLTASFLLFFFDHARAAEVRAVFKVGITKRSVEPKLPYNWRASKMRALATTIWYPANDGAMEQPQFVGPPDGAMAIAGTAALNADLAAASAKLPLILLSHGTGGSAAMMAWIGTALAAQGYVVIAPEHPGNNALEPYTVQGFTLAWERGPAT